MAKDYSKDEKIVAAMEVLWNVMLTEGADEFKITRLTQHILGMGERKEQIQFVAKLTKTTETEIEMPTRFFKTERKAKEND